MTFPVDGPAFALYSDNSPLSWRKPDYVGWLALYNSPLTAKGRSPSRVKRRGYYACFPHDGGLCPALIFVSANHLLREVHRCVKRPHNLYQFNTHKHLCALSTGAFSVYSPPQREVSHDVSHIVVVGSRSAGRLLHRARAGG